jgi:RHS repeat-associated protein
LQIQEENNYYPFGLKHKGYNNNPIQEFKYKTYQGQEWHDELGLNLHEWKYRFSDPAIGRFISIDPLAEDYEWQSIYVFSSNQPIHAGEIEGLESGFDLRLEHRIKAFANGEITKEEYLEQNAAEGKGALIGASLVLPGPEDLVLGGLALKFLSNLFRGKKAFKTAKEVLEINKKVGKEGEKIATKSLKKEFEGDEVLNQVTGKFKDGTTTKIDDVVVDTKTGKVKLANETKTGNAKLSGQQDRLHNKGESVELVGKNASNVKGQVINNTNTTTRTSRVDVKTKKVEIDN